MNLTPQNIQATVDSHINGDALSIAVAGNQLASPKINDLIQSYFGGLLSGDIIRQGGATSLIQGNQVVYQLTLQPNSILHFPNLLPETVELRFFEKSNLIALTIGIQRANGYRFLENFAEMAAIPTVPINQLLHQDPHFLLQSESVPTIGFSSWISPIGPLKMVSWMFDAQTQLSGTITLEVRSGRVFPIIQVTGTIPSQFAFGNFSLSLSLRVNTSLFNPIGGDGRYLLMNKVELVTQFKTGKLNLPVVLPLFGEGQYMLSFYVDTTNGPIYLNNINDLSGFTGGNLDGLVPTEILPSNAKLGLKSLSFVLNPIAKQLVNFQIGVDLATNWEIIPDFVALTGLSAEFIVEHPTLSNLRQISTRLGADFKIGSVTLETLVELPKRSFHARMQEGDEIDINEVLNTLTNGLSLPGNGNLSVYDLELFASAEKGNESVQVEAAARGDLEIISGFSIKDVFLSSTVEKGSLSEASIGGTFVLSNAQIEVFLSSQFLKNNGWQFEGRTLPGQLIPIGSLIDDLANSFGSIELPDVLSGLTVSNLLITFNTQSKNFRFSCLTQFPLDDQTAQLQLDIDIINSTAGFKKSFSGVLSIGSRQFTVKFDSDSTSSSLVAAFANPAGEQIHLINDLLGVISQNPDLEVNDEFNLLEFTLYSLQLSFQKNKTNGQKSYGIKGDFGWNPNLSIGSSDPLKLRAQIDLTKPAVGKISGEITGTVQTSIPGVEFLKLGAFYRFSQTASALGLFVKMNDVGLEAAYASNNPVVTFRVATSTSLTLKKVMNFFAGLVNPSIDDFDFDPPWDTFTDIEFPLNGFALTYNTSTKAIGFEYLPTPAISIPGLPSSLLSIRRLGLSYGVQNKQVKGQTKAVKAIKIVVEGTFLGKSQTLSWDPINDAPPQVPGQGASVFDLRYLGMGQHVAFTKASQIASVRDAMTLLRDSINERASAVALDGSLASRNPLDAFGDGGVIAFSPESEWLIGMDVTLLKTVSLSVIFNDPVIYGLRLELTGKLAKNFAGLQFEILYQKISDSVGKYHIDFTLPSFVRTFQMGAVTVTLPSIVLDIFTNGDFKVDLGFPWNFNFSRSFALEAFPFTGAGGLYFNKLSAVTASSTPVVPVSKGSFTPVYEFGIGLKVGLGKSFRSGPLNAEISITMQGLIEGVISWYNPVQTGSRELYYKIKGGVALVGRIYGEVDFGIVSASIEVIARAMIQFIMESYKPVQLQLTARVSARASVKIAFVRIRFSFSMTVRQSFTLPSPEGNKVAPWIQ